MAFVFDTSSIRVLGNYYPETFSSFWQGFEKLVGTGEVISVREVLRELTTQISKDDWLYEWVSEHSEIFLTPEKAETEFVSEIFSVPHFQELVGQKQRLKGTPVADPWVIACARVRKGCVVTQEGHKLNAAKIPNVCEQFGVRCIDLEGFLAEKGWKF